MKISVTLKDPDGFSEGVDEAVEDSLKGLALSQNEQDALLEKREENVWDALDGWVDCKEYITIEFDTEAGTATVRPRT
jgi:hypothetical protein